MNRRKQRKRSAHSPPSVASVSSCSKCALENKKSGSETNYSGFRGAIDQARQRWREIQSWMMGSFDGPVYEWKVRQWAVTDSALRKAVERADSLLASLGYIPVGEVNPFAQVWHAQELPYIQPVDDATADIL